MKTQRLDKLLEEEVLNVIEDHNICALLESHTSRDAEITVEGYMTFHNPRYQLPGDTKKAYGGVVVLVKDDIRKGCKEVLPRLDDSIWIELQKDYFTLPTNVRNGFTYIPSNIRMAEDPFQHLVEDCNRNPEDTPHLVMGDLNARVGHYQNTTTSNALFKHVECIPEDDRDDDSIVDRCLHDSSTNAYGRELLRVATDGGLTILNGSSLDASKGSFTCFAQPAHPTTIDLGLFSEGAVPLVRRMNVLDYHPGLSDHSPLSVQTSILAGNRDQVSGSLKTGHPVELAKLYWTAECEQAVICSLLTDSSVDTCQNITQKLSTADNGYDINKAIKELNELLFMNMASNTEVSFHKTPAPQTRRGGRTHQAWYDKKCEEAKNRMTQIGNSYRKQGHPLPPAFYGQKEHYEWLIKRKEAAYRKRILASMSTAKAHDPHKWWELLRKLNGEKFKGNVPLEIPVTTWEAHFSQLLNPEKDKQAIRPNLAVNNPIKDQDDRKQTRWKMGQLHRMKLML